MGWIVLQMFYELHNHLHQSHMGSIFKILISVTPKPYWRWPVEVIVNKVLQVIMIHTQA